MMKNISRLKLRGLVFKSTITSLLYILSSSAWAVAASPGQLIYGPSVTEIPTLSGTMLILLSLLLATIGYRILRQKENNAGRMMVLSLLAVGTLTSGLGGIKLIGDTYANGSIPLTDPGGSTLNLTFGTSSFINQTGGVTEILGRTANAGLGCGFAPIADECTVGKKLAIDEVCYINLICT